MHQKLCSFQVLNYIDFGCHAILSEIILQIAFSSLYDSLIAKPYLLKAIFLFLSPIPMQKILKYCIPNRDRHLI